MDHIENFEEICTTTKSNGVPPDYVKCKLFHFSLADKGTRWLKSLPAGSLRSWDECRNAFLDFFYTKSRTAQLRSRITQFQQYSSESFYEAWERFKEYRRECPHHGYSDVQILTIFYDGVDWNHKTSLDAASNGDFCTKNDQEAFQLIENLATSSSNRSQEYDRTRKVDSVESRKFDELNEKLNLLIRSNQRSVQQVESGTCAERIDDQEVSYVNGQMFMQQQKPFNQGFAQQQPFNKPQMPVQFQPQYQAPAPAPAAPFDELKLMMQQLMINQQKSANDINTKVDSMYSDLNGKFEALSSHVKMLDVQVAQTAEAVKRQEGVLPGKPDTNPRQFVNAIISGDEAEVCHVSQTVMDEEELVLIEKAEEADDFENTKKMERVYIPKAPYPTLSRKPKAPIDSVVLQKDTKMQDENEKPVTPLRKLQKRENPGQFYITCSVNGIILKDSLCDSGANVNVMSQVVAKKLGILDLQTSKIAVESPFSSSVMPKGFVRNVMLQIGDCLVPVDFHVMKINEDNDTPMILGSAFLATVGAIMDFSNQRISFSKIDKKVFYPVIILGKSSCMSVTAGEKLNMSSEDEVKLHRPVVCHEVDKAIKVVRKPKSKPFANVSIIIPLKLRDKEGVFIKKELQDTIALFPYIASWETREGKLVGKARKRSQARKSGFEGDTSSTDPSPA